MQQVHINRLGVNSIEFDSAVVELSISPGEERSFELVVINYGAPTHVNLSMSDSLRENITTLEDNPYVRHEEYIPIIARIPYGGRLYTKGQFFVTVGYGSKKAGFDLNIGSAGPGDPYYSVDVDSSLSTPGKSISTMRRDSTENGLVEDLMLMLSSFIEALSSKSVYVLLASIVLVALVVLVMTLRMADLSSLFGFYPSVVYSILLTFTMALLLIKLPIFK